MSLRKIAIFAVVLGILLLYISKVELVKDEQKRVGERPLEKLAAVALEEIEISNAKGSFALVNAAPKAAATKGESADLSLTADETAQWSIKGIQDSWLDRGSLNALISALRSVALENPLAPEDTEADLAVYGLAKPEVTLAVRAKDASGASVKRTYELGKLNEYVSKRYLKDAASATVYLSSNDLFLAANKESSELRNATPVQMESGAIHKLIVRPKGDPGFTLEQHDGVWKIATPGPFSASQASVDGVLRELRNLKVTHFIDSANGDVAQYGLKDPILTIETEIKEGRGAAPLYLSFGRIDAAPQGGSTPKASIPARRFFMAIKGQAPVFEIGVDPVARIVKTAKELRDRQLIKLDTDLISEARIAVSGRDEVVLSHEGDMWKVNSKAADTPFVREFLSSVGSLEALDFPEQGATVNMQQLTATLSFTLTPKGSEGTLVGAKSENRVLRISALEKAPTERYLGLVEGSTEPFVISAESFKRITPRLEALLKSESVPESPTPAESEVASSSEGPK
jgi:hypothetical protein